MEVKVEVELLEEDMLVVEVEGCAPAGSPGLPPHPHHHLPPKVLQETPHWRAMLEEKL